MSETQRPPPALPGQPRRPTPEITAQLVGYVRAGGYPEVAAEAAGVPRDLFARWLERGRCNKAREPYRSFALAVAQALAQARLRAEIETRQKVPRFWLSSGPGRERADTPGWTSQVKPRADDGEDAAQVGAELARLIEVMMTALAPYPDARAAMAEALLGTRITRPKRLRGKKGTDPHGGRP